MKASGSRRREPCSSKGGPSAVGGRGSCAYLAFDTCQGSTDFLKRAGSDLLPLTWITQIADGDLALVLRT